MENLKQLKIITVSASCKDVGKTSLVVYLIRNLLPCSAVKFSIHENNPYGEGIIEEQKSYDNRDTGRMKQAGALPVYWVKTDKSLLKKRLEEVLVLIKKNTPPEFIPYKPKIIMEGNSILDYLKPDYSIFLMNCTFDDFKKSAWMAIEKGDIILIKGKFSPDMENKCRTLNKKGKILFSEEFNIKESYGLILKYINNK